MKKNLIAALFIFIASASSVLAQSEDAAIKSTLTNYLEGVTQGDTAKLNKAFHVTALLKTFNATTGKIQDFPVKTFIAKTPAGGVQATGKIVSFSYAGISAAATVELAFEDFKYIDQISLLKINDTWKIVARVFSRVGLDVETKGSGGSTATKTMAAPTPKKVNSANAKPKKDDGW